MFEKGNFITVVGSTLEQSGQKTDFRFETVRIIEVGKFELLVKPLQGSYRRAYRVSKESCVLLDVNRIQTHVPYQKPKVGDIVLHHEINFTSKKSINKIGILVGIIDRPGSPLIGNLLHDSKHEEVPYENLMIIQEKSDCLKKQ